MGARSLRMKLQQARLVQYELSSSLSSPPLPTTSSIAYPPIFLSPSNFDAITPSPSPLPAAGSPHHEIPAAAIVGGGIAGVVALAATATIVSTVAGKVGLSCLLGPLVKLLSGIGGNLFGPCFQRLNSLRNTLNKCNPRRRRRRSNETAGNNKGSAEGDGDMLYEILGGSPTKESKVESTAAAALGGIATNPTTTGTMVPMPTKALTPPVEGNTLTSSSKGKRAGEDVMTGGKGKRKRPTNNLGHVSFSCEMSAHRLQFFTSCWSKGMYGSPPTSPDHSSTSTNNNKKTNNNNDSSNYKYYLDENMAKSVYPTTSSAEPYTAHNYQPYVPFYNATSHYNHMHQQLYHPSPSILVQRNTPITNHIAPLSASPLGAMDNKLPCHNSPKPSEIHDYGGPFDDFL